MELSIIPIKFILKMRRILYLQHILKQDENSLLYTFFMSQLTNPSYRDWVTETLINLEELEIDCNLQEIQSMSKVKFKEIVKRQTQVKAFEYLNKLKSEHSTIAHIEHKEWKMADYLAPTELELSIEERKYIFKCRSKDLDLKMNKFWMYEKSDKLCVCEKYEETQSHIIECEILINKNEILSYIPSYNELFGEDIIEKIYISRMLKENIRVRNILLDSRVLPM